MAEQVKKRDQRVLVILSAAERAAVENYRYAKRIETRAEAIRRLIRTAM